MLTGPRLTQVSDKVACDANHDRLSRIVNREWTLMPVTYSRLFAVRSSLLK